MVDFYAFGPGELFVFRFREIHCTCISHSRNAVLEVYYTQHTFKHMLCWRYYMLCWRFTILNTLLNICCVGGIRCCVGRLPYATHLQP